MVTVLNEKINDITFSPKNLVLDSQLTTQLNLKNLSVLKIHGWQFFNAGLSGLICKCRYFSHFCHRKFITHRKPCNICATRENNHFSTHVIGDFSGA